MDAEAYARTQDGPLRYHPPTSGCTASSKLLTEMPNEISLHIVSFLRSEKDICNLARTCTHWRGILEDDYVWKTAFRRCWPKHVLSLSSRSMSPCVVDSRICWKDAFIEHKLIEDNWRLCRYNVSNFVVEGCLWSIDYLPISRSQPTRFAAVGMEEVPLSRYGKACLFIYDTHKGRVVRALRDHRGDVYCLRVIQRDGQFYVLSGGKDMKLRLWQAPTDAEEAFSAPNSAVAAAAATVSAGSSMLAFEGHMGGVYAVAATDRIVLSGAADKQIIAWDIATGTAVHTMHGHSRMVTCLQTIGAAPDAGVVLSSSADRSVLLWDLRTCYCVGAVTRHRDQVWAVAVDTGPAANPHTWASGSWDKSILLHDLRMFSTGTTASGTSKTNPMAELQSTYEIRSLGLDSANARVVSGSNEEGKIGQISVWDMDKKRKLYSIGAHGSKVRGLVLGPDTILSASQDGTITHCDFRFGVSWRRVSTPPKQSIQQ